jgi:hypothetical protein
MVDPESYRRNLLNLLGNQNPLDALSKTAAALAGIIREHPASVLRARPFAGKWTPNEIIGHLVDGEWVYGYRLRLIVCEDCPTVLGTQQDAWVARQRHNEREPSELVEIFRTLREFNLAVWRRTTAAELERTGSHNERGPESLAVMLRMMAGHDLSHLAQIERYLGTLGPFRPTRL